MERRRSTRGIGGLVRYLYNNTGEPGHTYEFMS
jgi:hypothetical protein